MRSDSIEIVLARHGKPDLPHRLPRIGATELGDWTRRYNDTGINHAVAPPAELFDVAAHCGCIVASDLRRSVESATWLAMGREVQIRPDLREACLPEHIGLPFRLPARTVVAVARIAWWLGLGAAVEPIAATRKRAEKVACDLIALSEQWGTVLAVGHGTFNRFIATRLRRLGWRGARALPLSYWSSARYERDASSSHGRPRLPRDDAAPATQA